MNFDLGNILTRAWQITWKHKILWALHAMPMLVSFLFFPLFILPLFFLDESGGRDASNFMGVVFVVGIPVLFIFLFAANIVLNSFIMSATTVGVVRAERGEGSLVVMDLIAEGRQYFGRILGVMAIISLTIGLVLSVFFMLVLALTLVTMGLASICLQPLIILISPLSFLMVAVMEAAQVAVVTENAGAMDAVKRGWKVVKEHVWKYVILTAIIYFGSSMLMSILMFPLMLPFFGISFFMSSSPDQSSPMAIAALTLAFMCFFFPVMAAYQGVMMTFMKSSLDITYMRLTAPQKDEPIMVEANA